MLLQRQRVCSRLPLPSDGEGAHQVSGAGGESGSKGTGDNREAEKEGRSEEGTSKCRDLTVTDAEKGWGPS